MSLERAFNILSTKTLNDCPADYVVAFNIAVNSLRSIMKIKNDISKMDYSNGIISGEQLLVILADICKEVDRYE